MPQPSSLDLYNLACTYADLSILTDPASSSSAAQKQAMADRAMDALRRSVAAGFRDSRMLESDRDLDPLRQREDFRILLLSFTGSARETLADLVKTSLASPGDTLVSLKIAVLQAWFRQENDLAATRQRFLAFAKETTTAATAERAAKVCCLLPPSDKAQLETALALAREAVRLDQRSGWNLMALGMVEYRGGNYTAADEALRAAAEANLENERVRSTSMFYGAMSLFRQGKKDEAGKLAAAAAAKMKPLPADENNPLSDNANHDDLILWMAYKEARALIQFETAPAPK
jgi:hypothetical protein